MFGVACGRPIHLCKGPDFRRDKFSEGKKQSHRGPWNLPESPYNLYTMTRLFPEFHQKFAFWVSRFEKSVGVEPRLDRLLCSRPAILLLLELGL